jgi:hypothetical protein
MKAKRAAIENLYIALIYLLITIIMTYPIAFRATSGLPGDLGDPLLNAWILAWETQALPRAVSQVYHPPIFYPHRYSLTYSENLFGFLVVALPFTLAWGSPILGYNVAFLFVFWVSCLGMYKLIYKILGRHDVAFISGLLFAFAPYRWAQMTHLHILSYGWIPFLLATFVGYKEAPSAKRLLEVAFASFLAIMFSLHTGLFGLISLGVWAIVLCKLGEIRPRDFLLLALAEAIVLLSAALILHPYFLSAPAITLNRLPRLAAEADIKPISFFAATPLLKFLGFASRLEPSCERQLYPGLILTFLALLGLFGFKASSFKAVKVASVALAILGLIVYFGLGVYVKILSHVDISRYPFLILPLYGFSLVRAVSRWMILTWVGLGILAGLGLKKLAEGRLKLLLALVTILGLMEGWAAPLPIAKLAPLGALPELYHWLAKLPGDFAILELPAFYPLYDGETLRMYASLLHGKKLMTGYSGFIPEDTESLVKTMQDFPSPESIAQIAALGPLGLRFVIVESDSPLPEFTQRFLSHLCQFQADPTLRFVAKIGSAYVFEVRTFPQAMPQKLSYRELEVQFGDIATLKGYGIGLMSDGKLFVSLDWEAKSGPVPKYSVTVQAFDGQGRMLAQSDHPPIAEPFVQCWQPGISVKDERLLDISAGNFRKVGVAMYDWSSMEHLPIISWGEAYPDRFFWLEPLPDE